MNNVLEAQNLSKAFEINSTSSTEILKDVSFTIEQGEFVSVMGASGSGKSTLLYNISGMDRMTSGSVLLDGRELSDLTQKDLSSLRLTHMGFVFQQNHLLKNLCILDNIMLPSVLARKSSRRDLKERALQLMEQTGIRHLADRDITQVSGGELQRASICRALMNDPAILFGDEPTGALNSRSSSDIMDLFAEINRSGTTILLVTHDIRVAARSERVLYMLDGHIVSQKRPGKYESADNTLRQREAELSEWLNELGY